MKPLDKKINQYFPGKVVRKDLTKLIKGNAIVPTYVLEYLLGQYCTTDDEHTIKKGVENVKKIISEHFVHRNENQLIKSKIRERGSHRIIDKVKVKLNESEDCHEASIENLALKAIPIPDEVVKEHPKMLSHGVWCIISIGYVGGIQVGNRPWVIEDIKPIQISNVDIEEFKSLRKYFTTDEWMNLILQTMGLNPYEFTKRSKILQITRLVPFVENNYNLIELGPKGTGKSHVFSEFSPHGILISGGEVSKAKLFVNNNTKEIGLVGYWDLVAYDEFAGKAKKIDRGLVDIMKNYMANKSFSRGTEVYGATASMVFVGNTDHSVPYMMRHSNLFDALSKDYKDTALLDRMHAYLPGWEVQKLRNEMFSSDFGFIVDYLAEVLKELRKEDRTNKYSELFELSDSITTRDKDSIAKTYAGLSKVIYPNGQIPEDEARYLLEFAIECRRRVQIQLRKMDETFDKVDFRYSILSSNRFFEVETLEEIEHPEDMSPKEIEPTMEKETDRDDPRTTLIEVLEEGQKKIRENQSGISFDNLFGVYLKNATRFKLTDPYIRHPYQCKNLMELVCLIDKRKNEGQIVEFHLVTNNTEEYIEKSKEYFDQMRFSLKKLDIDFTYQFDNSIHDRSIEMNNGWKIVLGRGLDIWQNTGEWTDPENYIQEKRLCRDFEVTFVRHN